MKTLFGTRFVQQGSSAAVQPSPASAPSPQTRINRYVSPPKAQAPQAPAPTTINRYSSPTTTAGASNVNEGEALTSTAPKRVPFNSHLLQKKRPASKKSPPPVVEQVAEPPKKMFKAGFRAVNTAAAQAAPRATPQTTKVAAGKTPPAKIAQLEKGNREPEPAATHTEPAESALWKSNKVMNQETV